MYKVKTKHEQDRSHKIAEAPSKNKKLRMRFFLPDRKSYTKTQLSSETHYIKREQKAISYYCRAQNQLIPFLKIK